MRVLSWGFSDQGRKRSHNEDSLLLSQTPPLVAVADGMGGHVGGSKASRMAVDTLLAEIVARKLDVTVEEATQTEEPPAQVALRDAARACGRAIFQAAQQNPSLHGMGTTLTAMLFHEARAFLAHVGDSRAYVFRDGRLKQLSEDHSWVQEQQRAGWLTFDEARTSKFRHVITRSVGYERDVRVDMLALPIQMGDCFLLCSDGLSTFVSEAELTNSLCEGFFRDVPERLIALANDKGGDDNITAVVAYVANED